MKKMKIYCYSIKMSEQTLKFDHIVVNKILNKQLLQIYWKAVEYFF